MLCNTCYTHRIVEQAMPPTIKNNVQELSRANFIRQMVPMAAISVAAWATFATLFRLLYPHPSQPGDALGVWWIWLAVGTLGFIVATVVTLRSLETPPAWRAHAVVALTAPALICDMWTGTQTEVWLPNAGAADDRLYLSLIVGAVGLIQVLTLLTTIPKRTA